MRRAGSSNIPSNIVYPDGTKIGEWNLSTQMEEKYGQPLIAILWEDALRILSEALPTSCQHTGYDCIGITEVLFARLFYMLSYPLDPCTHCSRTDCRNTVDYAESNL